MTNEERQGGRRTQQQARMEIIKGGQMKGDKAAADHEGRQMKAGAAKSRPEWRSCRETNEGRQMKAGARSRAGQNGDHAGRQMKGDK